MGHRYKQAPIKVDNDTKETMIKSVKCNPSTALGTGVQSEKLKKNGFTLVELLVVIGILAVFGTMLLTIFTRTLKGSNKSQLITEIKQNGQSALELMDKTIRNADGFICKGSLVTVVPGVIPANAYRIIVLVKAGFYTRYQFVDPTASPLANGLIKQDNPVKTVITVASPLCPTGLETDDCFASRVCTAGDALVAPVLTLTDTNVKTGVSIENGYFQQEKDPGSKDRITINFNAKPGKDAPQSVAGQVDAVNFQTTVQLR